MLIILKIAKQNANILARKNVKERGVKLKERFARENIKKKVLVVASKNLRNTTQIRNQTPYLIKVPYFKIRILIHTVFPYSFNPKTVSAGVGVFPKKIFVVSAILLL